MQQSRSDTVKPAQPAWAHEEDVDDGREQPEYEFRYKQQVTTSDNFLGMSGKDPSSTCCEHLVLVVQLPHATSAAGERVFWCLAHSSAVAPAAQQQGTLESQPCIHR